MNSLQQPLILSFFLACFLTMPVSAADIAAGEQKAGSCVGCHGQKGNSSNAQWPNLAAQQSSLPDQSAQSIQNRRPQQRDDAIHGEQPEQ